jgi:hypothetical protein
MDPLPEPPLDPRRATYRLLAWVAGVTNAALAGLLLAGWADRPRGCPGGCPIAVPAHPLAIALVLLDVGLVLVVAAILYGRLLRIGVRIGERIAARRSRDG